MIKCDYFCFTKQLLWFAALCPLNVSPSLNLQNMLCALNHTEVGCLQIIFKLKLLLYFAKNITDSTYHTKSWKSV